MNGFRIRKQQFWQNRLVEWERLAILSAIELGFSKNHNNKQHRSRCRLEKIRAMKKRRQTQDLEKCNLALNFGGRRTKIERGGGLYRQNHFDIMVN